MKTELAGKHCDEQASEASPLTGQELAQLEAQLGSEWVVVAKHHLERQFKFEDFKEALEFTNRIGRLAEREGHHPDIFLTYGAVRLEIWTHSIDGLTENDFILAAKVNELKDAA